MRAADGGYAARFLHQNPFQPFTGTRKRKAWATNPWFDGKRYNPSDLLFRSVITHCGDREPLMNQEEMLDDLAHRIQQMQIKARDVAQQSGRSMPLRRAFHAKGVGVRAKFKINSTIPKPELDHAHENDHQPLRSICPTALRVRRFA